MMNKKTRLTLENAKKYLKQMFVLLSPNVNSKSIDSYNLKLKKMNFVHIRDELEKVSEGIFTLKGTRESTNISYAPPETQTKYKEAELLLNGLEKFIGKGGFEYECGVYCKKVLKKASQDTDKKWYTLL